MKLKDVIKLNDDMAPASISTISFLTVASAGVMMVMELRDSVGIVVAAIAMVLCLFMAYIPLKHIFSKSLFGEEAYRYMMLPISFRTWVTGKICSGAMACYATIMILLLCADYCMKIAFSTGASKFTDASAVALINAHAALSDGMMTTNSVVFIITAAPIAVILDSFFVSAIMLYGVIIRNLMDPRGEKPQTAIGVAAAAALIYLTANLMFIWAPGLLFKNDLAIPQLIIAAVLKAGAVYELAQGAARLLEKKYSLY